VVKLPEISEGKVITQHIAALAVDKNNKVYVVRWLRTRTENGDVENYMLDALDENYNVKQDSSRLEYLKATKYYAVKIAITKNNNIVVIQDDDPQVYICDNTGKLKNKFERGSHYIRVLGICGQNEIMIPSDNFQIYSEEGNLKSTVKLPEGHEVYGSAFNYVICKIIVLTFVEEKDSYFLLCYTEAGYVFF
jgi:outer membrane protein assembly factor BamB